MLMYTTRMLIYKILEYATIFKFWGGKTSLKFWKFQFFFLDFSTTQQALFKEEEGKLYGPGIAD